MFINFLLKAFENFKLWKVSIKKFIDIKQSGQWYEEALDKAESGNPLQLDSNKFCCLWLHVVYENHGIQTVVPGLQKILSGIQNISGIAQEVILPPSQTK